MAETFSGIVEVTHHDGTVTIRLDGPNGNLRLGGGGHDGDFAILDRNGNRRFNFSGDGMEFLVETAGGEVVLRIGPNGNVELGGQGHDGDLLVNRSDGTRVVHIDGQQANLWMGGNGPDGDIVLFPGSADDLNDTSQAAIWLDAGRGDIILRNADTAEDFEIAEGAEVTRGSVMVIDDDGRLSPCRRDYDRRVVGVVAGAGGYRPGIVMDRRPEAASPRAPIAMLGKAVCRADATGRPIRVGDLLTSSATPGAAMRAEDPERALGAIIGKALTPLDDDLGHVSMVIGLQ